MVEVCEGECMGCCPGDEPMTWMRCRSCEMPWPYELLKGRNIGKYINKINKYKYIDLNIVPIAGM